MALETGESLYWRAGIDNAAMQVGAQEAVAIITSMAEAIKKIDPFAIVGTMAAIGLGKVAHEATAFSISVTESMKEVESISSEVRDNITAYTNSVVDMSTRIPESADKLSKALYQVISAGYDGAAALQLLEVSATAAVAGVTDTYTAVDGLTTVLNAFGLKASEASRISDIMFQTVKIGKTEFPDLAQNMSIVASLAAASKVEFEEVAAAVATLTQKGVPTAMAMTQIRAAIIAMNETLGDGWANTMTLQEGMAAMIEKAGGSTTALRELTGRVEGMNAILSIAGDGLELANQHLEAMKNSAGASADAFAIMSEKLSVQSTILKNNMLAMLKPIGDYIGDKLLGLFKSMNSLFDEQVDANTAIISSSNDFIRLLGEEKVELKSLTSEIDRLRKIKDKTVQDTDDLATAEKSLAIVMQIDVSDALASAESRMDLYNRAKERGIEIDREIIAMRRDIAAAELEVMTLQKQQYMLETDEHTERLKRIASEREALRQQTKSAVSGIAGRVDLGGPQVGGGWKSLGVGFSAEKMNLSIEAEVEKTIESLKAEGIVIDGLEGKLNDINKRRFEGKDVTEEEAALLSEIYQKHTGIQKLDNEFALAEKERTLEIKKQNLSIESQQKLLEGLNKAVESGATSYGDKKPAGLTAKALKPLKDYRFDEESITSHIAKMKKAYADYENIIKWYGEDTASLVDPTLMTYGTSYEEYLKNLLEATKENAKAQKVVYAELSDYRAEQAEEAARKEKEAERKARELTVEQKNLLKTNVGKIDRDMLAEHAANLMKEAEKYEENSEMRQFWLEKYDAAMDEVHQREMEHLQNVGDAFSELADLVGTFDSGLSTILRDTASVVRDINSITNATDKWSKAGGIFSIATTAIGLFSGLFSGNSGQTYEEKLAKQMERLNKATQKQIDLLRQMSGLESISGLRTLFDTLETEISGYSKKIDELVVRRGSVRAMEYSTLKDLLGEYNLDDLDPYNLPDGWRMTSSQTAAFESLADAIADAKAQLAEYRDEYNELLTGTTADSIADSIAEGFKNGLRSAEDFADTFEDLMRNALVNTFKQSILNSLIEPIYAEMAARSEDAEGLSEYDIWTLGIDFQLAIQAATKSWENYEKIMEAAGLSLSDSESSSATGLTGAIAGITEETAGVLAGQFNAVRMNTAEIINSVNGLSGGANLANMVDRMDDLLESNNKIVVNTAFLRPIYQLLQKELSGVSVTYTDINSMRAMGG